MLNLRAILIAQDTCAAWAVTLARKTLMLELALSAQYPAVRNPVVPDLSTRFPIFPDFPDDC